MLDHLAEVRGAGGSFISSQLLMTEMQRAARRLDVSPVGVQAALGEILLLLPSLETFRLAGQIPGENVRALDALHIAAAIETGADDFLTYDIPQAEAANEAGIAAISPK